jgi:hypothetical protein
MLTQSGGTDQDEGSLDGQTIELKQSGEINRVKTIGSGLL